jgi:hypothetical protein
MKNTKTNVKFNIIDLLIVIVVIICLVFAVNVLKNRFSKQASFDMDVTLKITGISSDDIQTLVLGQKIFLPELAQSFGTVKKILADSHKEYIYNNEKARFTETEFADLYDVYLTLSVNCSKRNGRYYKDTFEISSNIHIKPDFSFNYDNAVIYDVAESTGDASESEK